ncbi:hypothetical protein SISSUDRAFT_1066244 [Sistotremastrum suecicum HHB10207 ss-3]|uniref:Uncharacterized protein n=1 Tax=Sistotremastrum suecicum HHB10207 ss-3 TaxID=1314776 RepID=A0A165YJD6_9AGAM|nr:hypothetical protein SISSUDRAFT_1066244 [Sistotremastrum suecicum HHB10207 ss-3]
MSSPQSRLIPLWPLHPSSFPASAHQTQEERTPQENYRDERSRGFEELNRVLVQRGCPASKSQPKTLDQAIRKLQEDGLALEINGKLIQEMRQDISEILERINAMSAHFITTPRQTESRCFSWSDPEVSEGDLLSSYMRSSSRASTTISTDTSSGDLFSNPPESSSEDTSIFRFDTANLGSERYDGTLNGLLSTNRSSTAIHSAPISATLPTLVRPHNFPYSSAQPDQIMDEDRLSQGFHIEDIWYFHRSEGASRGGPHQLHRF